MSKNVRILALTAAAMMTVAACKREERPPTPEERHAAEAQRKVEAHTWGDNLANEITYFRDPKTDLCFAYMYVTHGGYSDYATGGPALATVDCDKVETLLVNGPAPAEHPL